MTASPKSPQPSPHSHPSAPRVATDAGSGFWAGFRAGFSRPSLPGLMGSLAIAGAWFALAATLFNDGFLRRQRPESLMLDSKDSIARASVVAIQGAATHARGFTVCFAGTSDAEELIESPAWLEERFADAGHAGVHVVRLCAAALMVQEQRALVERFGGDFPGVFVLCVGPQFIGRPGSALADRMRRYRMPFRSDAFDDECRRMGLRPARRTGIDFLDNVRFYLQHTACVRAPWQAPRDFGVHALHKDEADASVPPLDEKECQVSIEDIPRNLECLGRTIDFIQSRGKARVVLLEIPRLHLLGGATEDPRSKAGTEAYRNAIREFAVRRQLPTLNVTAEAGLQPSDFYNTGHVGKGSARQRFGLALAKALLPHLPQEGSKP